MGEPPAEEASWQGTDPFLQSRPPNLAQMASRKATTTINIGGQSKLCCFFFFFFFALSWIMTTVAWSVAHKEARGFENFGHFLQGWKGRCVEPCTWAPSIELPSHTAPVCPLASQLTTSAVAQVWELQWVPLLSAQRIHDRGDTEGRWEGLICYWSSICGRRS